MGRERGAGEGWGTPVVPPRHLPVAWPLTWVHLAVSQLDLPLGFDHVEGQCQHRGHLWGWHWVVRARTWCSCPVAALLSPPSTIPDPLLSPGVSQTHRARDGPRCEADQEGGLVQPGLPAEPRPHQLVVKPVESWARGDTSATTGHPGDTTLPQQGRAALAPPCPSVPQAHLRRAHPSARWVPSPSRGTASRPGPLLTGCRHAAHGS